MTSLTKARCLELLRHPTRAAALELAEAVGREDPALADRLRTFVLTGMTEYGYGLSTDPDGEMPIHVGIRVVPLTVAVRLASDCARRVLPLFEEAFPSLTQPRDLLDLVNRWTRGRATRERVERRLERVARLSRRLADNRDAADAAGRFDHLTPEERFETGTFICVCTTVIEAGNAVVADSVPQALAGVGAAVGEYYTIRGEWEWPRQRLAVLVERIECGDGPIIAQDA